MKEEVKVSDLPHRTFSSGKTSPASPAQGLGLNPRLESRTRGSYTEWGA